LAEKFGEAGETEMQPLSPRPVTDDACHTERSSSDEESGMERSMQQPLLAPKWTKMFGNRWRASNPWRFGIDLPRALLEGLRAFVGYLL
jgi:hypothetical protein